MKAWAKTPYNSDILIVLCVLLGGGCNTTHTNIIAAAPANICTTGASLINPSAAPGLGGTGQIAGLPTSNALEQIEKRSGVGGTGRPETLAKGGVGGTGIVGVVTGFASICVNGVEVHFSRSTPIMVDGEHGSASELLVGQVVVIRATGAMNDSNAQLQAQQIFVQHAAVGPLTQVDAETGMFEVMGQPAQALTKKDLSNLRPGDWVRVSGHRLAEGTIRASHVQGLASPLPTAQILGFVTDIKGSAVWIGGTKVQFKTLPAGLSLGSEIAVNGRWNANQLEVLSNSLQPTRSELGVVNDVVLQGYVRTLHGRELTLGYESLLLSDRVRITGGKAEALQVNQPVQIRGHVGADHRIVVEQLKFSNDRENNGGTGGSERIRSNKGSEKTDNSKDSKESGSRSEGEKDGRSSTSDRPSAINVASSEKTESSEDSSSSRSKESSESDKRKK